MKYLTIALTIPIFLTACSTTPIGSDNNGFSIPAYSQEQRAAVHGELTGGHCAASKEFIKDYKVLRDQARVK